MDGENNITKMYTDRNDIERAVSNFNRNHYKKVLETNPYQDHIHERLLDDTTRDAVLDGKLEQYEVDDNDLYKFLSMLKTEGGSQKPHYTDLTMLEWNSVVKQSNAKSTSLIFSKQTYGVYKMTLSSDKVTNLLIRYYNCIMKAGYYPDRWRRILDVIVEKGKGPILGKLRIIQLIEADMQLLMRVFFSLRNQGNIEFDDRISKYNFGSRKGCSVENAILEKRLIYESNLFNQKQTVHTLSDLEACYDRHLPHMGYMVEEAVGVERTPAIIFSKLVPRFQHQLCTSYGVSDIVYGGDEDILGGSGQGNVVSGNMCRDQSCIIFRKLEKDKLGILIVGPISAEEVRRAAIAWIDDTDFFTNGQKAQLKMQIMMATYTRLYESTGGKIKQIAVFMYSWKWITFEGEKKIINIPNKLIIKEHEVEQKGVHDPTITLGVWFQPDLLWSEEFKQIRRKLVESVRKLMNTALPPYRVYTYFHVYMSTSVFIGCGVVYISQNEEEELIRIYEEPIAQKFQLGKRFPHEVLYIHKHALGLGLMRPSTILASLRLKLYFGHTRLDRACNKLINANLEEVLVECGRNCNFSEI